LSNILKTIFKMFENNPRLAKQNHLKAHVGNRVNKNVKIKLKNRRMWYGQCLYACCRFIMNFENGVFQWLRAKNSKVGMLGKFW